MMDIQEVKVARTALGQAIAKLIEDFEWDTGVEVAGLSINRGKDEQHPRRLTIGVKVVLPEGE